MAPFLVNVLLASSVLAQAPPDPIYGYEVASIKKSDPAEHNVRIMPGTAGGLRTVNTNLMTLVTFAYDVREYQVLDAPSWAKSEGFDISFTPDKPEAAFPKPGEADAGAMQTMMNRQRQRMQAILRDRFGLKLRMETRELPVYGLTIAKGGSKLKGPGDEHKGPGMSFNSDRGEVVGTGANMYMLTSMLSTILQRPVNDETGLTGIYDVRLQWKPDSFTAGPGEPAAGADNAGMSIFTAVTEELGLKLESKKGPVKVFAIEKAERPGEN